MCCKLCAAQRGGNSCVDATESSPYLALSDARRSRDNSGGYDDEEDIEHLGIELKSSRYQISKIDLMKRGEITTDNGVVIHYIKAAVAIN